MITKIFIVEDHPIVRQVLSSLIDKQSDLCVCGEADSVQSALDKIPTSQADLVLIDISLPNGSGLHLLETLHKQLPDLKSLVVSGFEKAAFAQRALELGARGYVVKGNMVTLLEAIHVVMAGDIYEDGGIQSE